MAFCAQLDLTENSFPWDGREGTNIANPLPSYYLFNKMAESLFITCQVFL